MKECGQQKASETLTATPLEASTEAGSLFPCEAWQVKPLSLSMVGPEKSHISF